MIKVYNKNVTYRSGKKQYKRQSHNKKAIDKSM